MMRGLPSTGVTSACAWTGCCCDTSGTSRACRGRGSSGGLPPGACSSTARRCREWPGGWRWVTGWSSTAARSAAGPVRVPRRARSTSSTRTRICWRWPSRPARSSTRRKHASGTLINALLFHAARWPSGTRGLLTRLDKLTSGVVLVAKRREVVAALQREMRADRIDKTISRSWADAGTGARHDRSRPRPRPVGQATGDRDRSGRSARGHNLRTAGDGASARRR